MLSCGRVIGRLPKLTRQAPVNYFYRPLKYIGVVGISNLWYSNDASSQKTHRPAGTTAKPEECVPESRYSKPKRIPPMCESAPNASCPPSCYEVCGRPTGSQGDSCQSNSGFGKDGKPPPYWKILATMIITGVAIYAISTTNLFTSKESDSTVSKKKDEGPRRYRRSQAKGKNPPTASSIPQEVPYLLIGGGTAAFSAFRSIKSRDPKAKVLVITEEPDFPYMRPPLSKELWYNTDRTVTAQLYFRQWNGTQRSIFYEPKEFYSNVSNLIESDKGGVAVATGWKVTKVDAANKVVTLDDGYEIKYDKCLIATGASPKTLPVFENAKDEVLDKVITFRTKEDFLELEDRLHDPACKNIVIIGGGFLGSELACALARNLPKDKKVYQVYKEKFIMAQVLPEYLSEWTTKMASAEGVHAIPTAEVNGYRYKDGKLSLMLTDERTIDADQVVLAVGVQPNTDLASTSHLETHPQVGGFLVNAELQARSNVWVAGDVACFYDIKLGRRRVEHHDHAVFSGRIAGENMTGAEKPYTHQSMFWSDLGPEVGYEAIGIIDSSLPTVGVFAEPTESDTEQPVSSNTDKSEPSNEEETNSAEAQNIAKSKSVSQKPLEASNINESAKDDNKTADVKSTEQTKKDNNFEKGVIFYLRNDIVVGIVLWNIFNRMSIARQVLARGTKYDDLNEVAKLFTIHDD